jgi:hypothetical protein
MCGGQRLFSERRPRDPEDLVILLKALQTIGTNEAAAGGVSAIISGIGLASLPAAVLITN